MRTFLRTFHGAREALRSAGPAASRRSGKSLAAQALDLMRWRMHGYTPDDYYTLRLYEHGREGSPRFLNRREFSGLRLQLNPRETGVVPFNKWVSCLYFEALGVRVPRCYGIYHPARGVDRAGQPLKSLKEFRILLNTVPGGVVIKPLDASHGHGVMVLSSYDHPSGEIARASGTVETVQELHARLDAPSEGWVIQERLRQHPRLSSLHASSVNTVRLITLAESSGVVNAIGAVLRIGVGTSEIDNTTGGGIVAPIDLDSGVAGRAISRFRITDYEQHPDSGTRIEGLRVPLWREVLEIATRAHRMLPFPRTLGWDIAVTDDEPVVIEVNSDYYYNHLQLDGQLEAVELLRRAAS